VPREDDATASGWRVTRVTIEDDDYARWLAFVQRRGRDPGAFSRGLSFWGAGVTMFFLVFFGIPTLILIIAAIVRLVR